MSLLLLTSHSSLPSKLSESNCNVINSDFI
nr:MAG TPA: hypothetical protein [Caudoviricetes sp.]